MSKNGVENIAKHAEFTNSLVNSYGSYLKEKKNGLLHDSLSTFPLATSLS
jgi:hypothetical protein